MFYTNFRVAIVIFSQRITPTRIIARQLINFTPILELLKIVYF